MISKTFALALAVVFAASATPASSSGTIAYGSRGGMVVSVVSESGLDTDHAIIRTKHTRANAIAFCRDYILKITEGCISDQLKVPLAGEVHADCSKGVFTDFRGERYQFEGLNPTRQQNSAKYALLDLGTNQIADGSEGSGYYTNLGIFRALCPKEAPAEETE